MRNVNLGSYHSPQPRGTANSPACFGFQATRLPSSVVSGLKGRRTSLGGCSRHFPSAARPPDEQDPEWSRVGGSETPRAQGTQPYGGPRARNGGAGPAELGAEPARSPLRGSAVMQRPTGAPRRACLPPGSCHPGENPGWRNRPPGPGPAWPLRGRHEQLHGQSVKLTHLSTPRAEGGSGPQASVRTYGRA